MASKWEGYTLDKDGLLRYKCNMYVLTDDEIQKLIMKESYQAPYAAHLGVQKMYVDFKQIFFWTTMKKDITQFVAGCLEC